MEGNNTWKEPLVFVTYGSDDEEDREWVTVTVKEKGKVAKDIARYEFEDDMIPYEVLLKLSTYINNGYEPHIVF